MKKLKLLSLFSGIGAFEKALTNLGVDYTVINYCEIDKFASYAYSILHNVSEDLNLGDVSKVYTKNIQDFDLLTYGFPCQDISLAGKMKGIIKGETRSGLLYEALRIIKNKKPKYAIAENVRNLVSNRFEKDFNAMIAELDNIGYNSYWNILNSKDYGSAQSRERVFIVSIRKDIDKGDFKFPAKLDTTLTMHNILENNVDEKYYINNIHSKGFIKKINDKITDNKKCSLYGTKRIGMLSNYRKFNISNRIFSTDAASPTLITGADSIPKILNFKVRRLSPLECWKLTGFTKEDYFKVRKALENKFYNGKDKSDTQMYKMAGNSIVVQVLEHILANLLTEVKDE